jgi:hypothetical protein
VLERFSAVSGADLGAEDEDVATVENGSWLDDDSSRRVRHVIFDEIPTWRASCQHLNPTAYQGEYPR